MEVQWNTSERCSLDSCVQDASGGGALRRLRFHLVNAGGLLAALTDRLLGDRWHGRIRSWWSRNVPRACGVRVRVLRAPQPVGGRGVLVVANHTSWLDMAVLNGTYPGRFVAKAGITGEGYFLRLVAALTRVVRIERDDLASVAEGIGRVAELLRAGETVIVFPEACCWCGRHQGVFRPAFFQAALDAGAVVQPAAVRYRSGSGDETTVTAYVGDIDTFGASLRRITATDGITADITFLSPIESRAHGNRRSLARAAQEAVAAGLATTSERR